MLRCRKVGTLTAGIVLVVFGLLFLARLLWPAMDYKLILSLWPLVLLCLGLEVIISCFVKNEESLKYDGGAIVLMIMLAVFSFIMAGAEFVVHYLSPAL